MFHHTIPAVSSYPQGSPPAPAASSSWARVPFRIVPAILCAVSRMCPCVRGRSEASLTGGAISCARLPTRWWLCSHVTHSGKGLRQRPCALLTASSPATSKGELLAWPGFDRWQSSSCVTPEPWGTLRARGVNLPSRYHYQLIDH